MAGSVIWLSTAAFLYCHSIIVLDIALEHRAYKPFWQRVALLRPD
jgi:hypothetical protein